MFALSVATSTNADQWRAILQRPRPISGDVGRLCKEFGHQFQGGQLRPISSDDFHYRGEVERAWAISADPGVDSTKFGRFRPISNGSGRCWAMLGEFRTTSAGFGRRSRLFKGAGLQVAGSWQSKRVRDFGCAPSRPMTWQTKCPLAKFYPRCPDLHMCFPNLSKQTHAVCGQSCRQSWAPSAAFAPPFLSEIALQFVKCAFKSQDTGRCCPSKGPSRGTARSKSSTLTRLGFRKGLLLDGSRAGPSW